jgi:hypothetical protein
MRYPFLSRLFSLIILCACILFLSSLSIFSMVEEENIPKVEVFTRRSIATPLVTTIPMRMFLKPSLNDELLHRIRNAFTAWPWSLT